ncbi:XdhC family protein [Lentzea guizhouensis]|uniref:XdhC family protein n=1 Tax=Lentzea guizhouensis TaxID=1586287 RepID=UPI0008FF1A69
MLELADRLAEWKRQHRRFAVATVVSVSGSAPRPVGDGLCGRLLGRGGGQRIGGAGPGDRMLIAPRSAWPAWVRAIPRPNAKTAQRA